MNHRWYYKSSEAEVGPISFSGLRRMALEELLSPETLVRAGEEGEWIAAGTVEDLFAPKRERTFGPPT
jgi:hypothetical protein